jgi:hypothetical protein
MFGAKSQEIAGGKDINVKKRNVWSVYRVWEIEKCTWSSSQKNVREETTWGE